MQILFILNTYGFQNKTIKKKISIKNNYKIFNKLDKTWFNFIYNNLSKEILVEKYYPNLEKYYFNLKDFENLKIKINNFKPNLIFSTINNKNLESILSEQNKIRKILWISHNTDKKKLDALRKTYQYLMSNLYLILTKMLHICL